MPEETLPSSKVPVNIVTGTDSPKPRLIVLLLSVIAIIGLHLLYLPELKQLKHDALFMIFDVLLVVASLVFQALAIHNIDDPSKDYQFTIGIIIFVVAFVWAGGWLADYRSEVQQGIQYNYTQPKAK